MMAGVVSPGIKVILITTTLRNYLGKKSSLRLIICLYYFFLSLLIGFVMRQPSPKLTEKFELNSEGNKYPNSAPIINFGIKVILITTTLRSYLGKKSSLGLMICL